MKARILVADDDANMQILVKDYLEKMGFEVLQAWDGQQALNSTVNNRPDLIILDMMMPLLNGWEVAGQIHQKMGNTRPKIIAFTAHALDGEEEHALKSGCDAYISKPFTPKHVLEVVRTLLHLPQEVR